MPDLLTTDEAAIYLRLSERKLYELVANGAVPCTKVTGKWLFPKAALDRWLAAGLVAPEGLALAPPPLIVGGSHDPLLEWALRESASALASLPVVGLLLLGGGIAIWRLSLHPPLPGTIATGQRTAAPVLPDQPSIAVLPFVNMSGDAAQEYFSDGMTEDLITDLARLRIWSKTSSRFHVHSGTAR